MNKKPRKSSRVGLRRPGDGARTTTISGGNKEIVAESHSRRESAHNKVNLDLSDDANSERGRRDLKKERYFQQLFDCQSIKQKLNIVASSKLPSLNWNHFADYLRDNELKAKPVSASTFVPEAKRRKWLAFAAAGFNLLFHGFGSKCGMLDELRESLSADFVCVTVRGYRKDVNLQAILSALASALDCEVVTHVSSGKAKADKMDMLKDAVSNLQTDFFLFIHNIDGVALRSESIQNCFAQLAESSRFFHVLASIDHVNAALLWDQKQTHCFNWLWINVERSSFSYAEELLTGDLLTLNVGGWISFRGHSLASLHSVWTSLTQNSVSVFLLLARHFMQHHKQQHFRGMSFPELYKACRGDFLVVGESALRAQLVEFTDHHLLQSAQSDDGTEYLRVTVDAPVLQDFLIAEGFDEFESVEATAKDKTNLLRKNRQKAAATRVQDDEDFSDDDNSDT